MARFIKEQNEIIYGLNVHWTMGLIYGLNVDWQWK